MIFCGIFDGHGPWGHFVAKKVRESIVSSLLCNWQESLAEASVDPDLDLDSDKKLQRFNIWKDSYLKACAAVDQELEHHPKIDTFYSGTTALTIVRQVILLALVFFFPSSCLGIISVVILVWLSFSLPTWLCKVSATNLVFQTYCAFGCSSI